MNLRDLNLLNDEIRLIYRDGFIIAKYLHGGIDFTKFHNRLCKGLVFDKYGELVLVGFENFFNYEQLKEYQSYNDDFKNKFNELEDGIYTCYEKLDGTMLILGVYKNEFIVSSSSSISTDYSLNALKFFNSLENTKEIKDYLINRNSCLVFEYISPYNKIVVDYNKEDYVLLGEVSKDTCQTIELKNNFGFNQPKLFRINLEKIIEFQRNNNTLEGLIVFNQYNKRIKCKTDWWFKEHYKSLNFIQNKLTKRNVRLCLEFIKNDTIDDVYSNQPKVAKLFKTIEDFYRKTLKEIDKLLDRYNTPKELYLNSSSELNGLVVIKMLYGNDVLLSSQKLENYIYRSIENGI